MNVTLTNQIAGLTMLNGNDLDTDLFIFNTTNFGQDTVTDFLDGTDIIDLRRVSLARIIRLNSGAGEVGRAQARAEGRSHECLRCDSTQAHAQGEAAEAEGRDAQAQAVARFGGQGARGG